MRVAVNARKVNLLAVDRSFNITDDEHVAVLPVDAKLHEFTVSVSGKAPRIRVTDPQGPSLNFAPFFPFHIYLTPRKIKVKVNRYSSSQPRLTATGTHMPYGITKCYLPPSRDDIPAFTLAEAGTRFSDPGWMVTH